MKDDESINTKVDRVPLNANIPKPVLKAFRMAMAEREITLVQEALAEAMKEWAYKREKGVSATTAGGSTKAKPEMMQTGAMTHLLQESRKLLQQAMSLTEQALLLGTDEEAESDQYQREQAEAIRAAREGLKAIGGAAGAVEGDVPPAPKGRSLVKKKGVG